MSTRLNYLAVACDGQLLTEGGPFSNDTLTTTCGNRLRSALALQQPRCPGRTALMTGPTTTFTVDSRDQLPTVAGTSCSYDSNGNLSLVGVLTNGPSVSYTYDDENRLTSVKTNYASGGAGPMAGGGGMWQTDFVYDGFGRLRKRLEYVSSTLQSTTLYVYDGWRVIQERDASSVPGVSYTRGLDLSGSLEGAGGIGGLLARSEGSTQASYFADGNGNITSLSGGNLAVVASYRYDPYGNLLFKSGAWADTNVYRFSSKECHVKSGMYYYLYRWYAPELQRWITRDPIEEAGFEGLRDNGFLPALDGPNLYLFVNNAPGSFIDSDGLSAVPIPLPGGIVIPVPAPVVANPIGASLCGGAAVGAALCCVFPNTVTKPGEWVGNLISPNPRTKTCNYVCYGGNAGPRGGTIRILIPINKSCSPRLTTPSGGTCDLLGPGPIKN